MPSGSLLQRILAGAADRIALEDGTRAVAYSQLASLIPEERRWLEAAGERVALYADNGCAWALADLALHDASLVNVPLPAYFTAQQLQHVVRDAGVDSILTDRAGDALRLWPEFSAAGTSPRTGLALLRRSANPPERRAALPAGTRKVTYTSGSTAEPKGVCLSASALESVAYSVAEVTAPLNIARHLCVMPLPTLLENVAGIYAPLLSGASCFIPPVSVSGMHYAGIDATKLLGSIAQSQPESLILVPQLLSILVQAASRGWPVPRSLKFIAVGGAVVSPELLEEAADLHLPVFQGYGLSECASVACLNPPTANRAGSVGKPLPHARVRTDSSGQIFIRGATMLGYLGDEPGTQADELATGDLGTLDEDGYVYIHGRMRNVFITSFGRNISPEWIERELTRESCIRHAIAIGEARPCAAALVVKAHRDVEPAEIQRAVARANGRLPDYARVGRWAVMPDEPALANGLLTSNGRLRREKILAHCAPLIDELYEAPAPTEST